MIRLLSGVFGVLTLVASGNRAALADPVPAAPADLGPLAAIHIDTGRSADGTFTLTGADARQQLIVTGDYASGSQRDLARTVAYEATPAGIVQVSSTGLVMPLANGQAQIVGRTAEGGSGQATVVVKDIGNEPAVNFPNQVVPIFTKLGCNAGACHGKASGQNGFRLSLLGFEPTEDYEHLVKEGRGRRLFPAAPDASLLLKKSLGEMPHGGGARLTTDSDAYRILRRWIIQGMPYGRDSDPVVARIEVVPPIRTMARTADQQLAVIAHYSDGSSQDVTNNTRFDVNNIEMAEVSPTGLVHTQSLTGDVAVMARYQGQVSVYRASVPLGAPVNDLPPARSFIDELVFKKLKVLGVPPSALCDDATFLRRVTTDVAGRLPTAAEAERFAADADPAKRDKWIDSLLASTDYADFFASKWGAILRNKRRDSVHTRGTYAFHAWLRAALATNVPYDQIVRDVLTASGEIGDNPPVVWYREVKETNQQVEDTAQLFLGLRIQCARCHHHPFEKWSQQDYYGLAAYFSRVGRKKGQQPGEERIYSQRGQASATNPKTQKAVKPAGLGAAPPELADDDDPRQALVDWMVAQDNPFFARALVNRYWKHFFGRGLVDPEDDMRATNPAANEELLQSLASHFLAKKFDLKDLVRTICQSQAYQLSAEPNEFNSADKQNFSRFYPRRLPAEVLSDAIDQVTSVHSSFSGLPASVRAVQLPDTNFASYFLTVFGRPESTSACECERSGEASLAQCLHLVNSSDMQNKLSAGNGRAATLAGQKERAQAEKLREVYLQVFSRPPKDDELAVAVAYLAKAKDEKIGFEDILWALVNTKEFLFNH